MVKCFCHACLLPQGVPADAATSTWFRGFQLGIDPRQTFNDHSGRPIPMLDEGQPIAEVI